MPADYELYVGIDWGTEQHHVCFIDAGGQRVGQQSIAHSGAGLAALVSELARRVAAPSRIAIALETPRGALIDALLAHGCHVFAINPKQLDRFRDRHTVAGAKDDRRDAWVLADALRTDRRAFHPRQTDDPRLAPLRERSRLHSELVAELTRATNRLRDQLLRFYPQALALCPAADEPWLWTLLERAPTPAAARQLRPNGLRALLAEHRIRRVTATRCTRRCRRRRCRSRRRQARPWPSTSAFWSPGCGCCRSNAGGASGGSNSSSMTWGRPATRVRKSIVT